MQQKNKCTVILCTDEPTRGVGFRKCFDSHPEFLTLPCIENTRHLTELMASAKAFPHVLVLHSKAQTAKRVLASVREMKLDTKVVLWPSEVSPAALLELTKHGLAAILERGVEPEELVSVVRHVARGERSVPVTVAQPSGRTAGAAAS